MNRMIVSSMWLGGMLACFGMDPMNFSSSSFVKGALNGQAGWEASPECIIVESAMGQGVIFEDSRSKAVCGAGPVALGPGESVSYRIGFCFLEAGAGNVDFEAFGCGICCVKEDQVHAEDMAQIALRIQESSGAVLQLCGQDGDPVESGLFSYPLKGHEKDHFAIDYTLTLAASASESTVSGLLINLTTGEHSELSLCTGISEKVFRGAGLGLYPCFHSVQLKEGSCVGGVLIESVEGIPRQGETLIFGAANPEKSCPAARG